MTTLIACLSTGKGTWTEVIKLINSKEWDKVFLITNQFSKDNFKVHKDNVKLISIDSSKDVDSLVKDIKKELKVDDFEAALNLISGTGKEHMAVLEAVLELGVNFRLVSLVNNKLEILGFK